jgi:hypothetical protein
VVDNSFIRFAGKLRSWGGTGLFSRAIDVQDMTDGQNVVAFNYGRELINHIWLDRDGSSNVILRNAVSVSQFQSSVAESGGLSTDPLFVSTSAGAEDFALQDVSPARNAGSGGVDLGAFAVYPATSVGYNPDLEPAELQVSFDSVIAAAVRGQPVELVLSLSRAAASPIAVEVVPVAGDAREGEDFTVEGRTVIFEPGATTQTLEVLTTGSSEHAELVAFGLQPSCAQGARNVALLQILTP